MDIVNYAEFLIKSICKEPDLVKVSSFEEENKIVLDIYIPESCMGMVMGRNGNNIKSIRVLLNAYAYLNKLKRLEINVESF